MTEPTTPIDKKEWNSKGFFLPSYDEYVLWYTEEGNYFVEALDKDGNDWLKKCTHWMHLPEPPK